MEYLSNKSFFPLQNSHVQSRCKVNGICVACYSYSNMYGTVKYPDIISTVLCWQSEILIVSVRLASKSHEPWGKRCTVYGDVKRATKHKHMLQNIRQAASVINYWYTSYVLTKNTIEKASTPVRCRCWHHHHYYHQQEEN